MSITELFDPILFSLFDRRSLTDPFTNSVILAPVNLQAHLGNILKYKFPKICLPAFLHEATHHWCFHSPVGITLTLLQFRAWRKAAVLIVDGSAAGIDAYDVLDDFLRCNITIKLLRPLSEGMAVFTECDVIPTTSEIISTPMFWASLLFVAEEAMKFNPSEIETLLRDLLTQMRLTEMFADRKSSYLLQSMTCGSGGYLPGYLTVKNLWIEAARRCSRFYDTDFFLTYLRSYIYEDFGLIAHLLNSNTKDIGATSKIYQYLVERVNAFCSHDLETGSATLERAIVERRAFDDDDWFQAIPNLASDTSLWNLGYERWMEMLRELKEIEPLDAAVSARLALQDQWTLAQRELMCVGRLDVSISISESNRVIVKKDEHLFLSGPAVNEKYAGRKGEGSVEVFISPSKGFVATVVNLDEDVVMTYFSRDPGRDIQEQFLRYRTNVLLAVHENELKLNLVKDFLENYDTSGILDFEDKRFSKRIDEWYGNTALPLVPSADLASRLEEMKTDGFFPILSKNVSLVKTLALVGLFQVCGYSGLEDSEQLFAEMRNFHRIEGTLEATVEKIRQSALAKLSDPIIHKENDRYFSCV
ncbi:hypothetical protein NIES4074_61650 (plasmid) [Cylindrospermum sp. NIES-4074]|nr:hypothetical protein NIES4074_61650 [Cylindrospermum sp. NIES-4074]